MAEEPQDVAPAEETAPESSTEEQTQATEEVAEEPVDESGVPLKNRMAELERKSKQRISQLEAQNALLSGATSTSTQDMTEDEAVKAVENIADARVRKAMEPLLAKQFLLEHPDATEMIDDINRIRSQRSHLAGVEHLEDAYKIAKAEKQDELIRQQVEAELRDKQVRQQAASQSTAEGVGKVKGSSKEVDLATRIANAKSMEELEALGASISA